MPTRLIEFAKQEQQGRKIDAPHRIVRMVANGLTEERAGGVLVAGLESQGAEIIQRSEIGRL